MTAIDRYLHTILRLCHGVRQIDADLRREFVILQRILIIWEILFGHIRWFCCRLVYCDVKSGQFARRRRTAVAARHISTVVPSVSVDEFFERVFCCAARHCCDKCYEHH